MLTALIGFVILIFICVTVHEYGHYITAKLLGVQVHEFAFGMGPVIKQVKKNNMLWSWRLIPIGGFCRLAGMDEEEDDEEVIPGMGFNEQPAWKRFFILLNGALFNIILALILSTMFLWLNGVIDTEHAVIGEVLPDLPAMKAGIKTGDEILSVNNMKVTKWREMSDKIKSESIDSENHSVTLEILRDGKILTLDLVIPFNEEYGRPMLGVTPANVRYGFLRACKSSAGFIYRVTALSLRGIADLVLRKQEIEVTGPVGIASMSGQAIRSGFWGFIMFIAIVSLNLGIFNLFPIPALDGGRILFVLLEIILRRRLPERVENWIHTAGFVFLITLIILITFHDIYNIFFTH